jgi:hypothetical protein
MTTISLKPFLPGFAIGLYTGLSWAYEAFAKLRQPFLLAGRMEIGA